MEKRYWKPEIETLSREDFLKYRFKELKKQIEYSYAKSGLCQEQFKKAKITPDDIKTFEDFQNKVPFTDKLDMVADQQKNPPYGTRLSVREDEIFLTFLTSGTSGKGQEVHTMTKADCDFYIDAVAMMYHWCGWKKGDKVMNPLPIGITIAAPAHYLALVKLECDIFNLGMYDTKTKLDYIKRFKLNGIFSTPAYIDTMTAEAEEMGIDPAKDLNVRKILTAIQAYPISWVEKIEKKWNAKLYDYYGSTQMALGVTCPEHRAVENGQRRYYHLLDHLAIHEVINPETMKPVGPSEVGEMVVTPLNKKASPFLRFRSADKVRWFPNTMCDCGRPYELLEAGTIARYDDMMKIKGVNIWPETIDEIIFTKPETSEYQGRIYMTEGSKEKSEIKLEFKKDVTPEVKPKVIKKIAAEISEATGINFDIKEAGEPLPHSVFKVRRWSDDRSKGLEAKK